MLKCLTLAICLLLSVTPAMAVLYVSGTLDTPEELSWNPSDHVVVVQSTVSAPAHEPFTDWNHNGIYDTSLQETYTDVNLNGQYDLGEPFTDYNVNGIFDLDPYPEPFEDYNGDGQYTDPLVLEIAPETIVKFNRFQLLSVNGQLSLSPAPASPVIFTSYRDDSYGGDTNGDGASSGGVGDWAYVGVGSGNAVQNCHFRFGGDYYNGQSHFYYGMLYVESPGTATVQDCVFENGAERKLYVHSATGPVSIATCTFDGTTGGGYGVYLSACGDNVTVNACSFTGCNYGAWLRSSPSTVTGCTFTNNDHGIRMDDSNAMITDNTLSHSATSGVRYPFWESGSTEPFYSGNVLQGTIRQAIHVDGTIGQNQSWEQIQGATGWVYLIAGNVTVSSGRTLTIVPGTVVKFNRFQLLSVNGQLSLSPAPASPVIFTSYRDDSYGGDTNGDGASSGGVGDWAYVGVGSGNAVQNCHFRFGGDYYNGQSHFYYGMLYVESPGTATVQDCVFENGAERKLYVHSATGPVSIATCTFDGTTGGGYGVYLSACGDNVTVNACSFTEVDSAVLLVASSSTFQDCLFSGGTIGIDARSGFQPQVSECDFIGQTLAGILSLETGPPVEAENNYWDDPRGPTCPLNPLGHGTPVGTNIDFVPYSLRPFWTLGGMMTGVVFRDSDGNGTYNPGTDASIAGATLSLEAGGAATSDESGHFSLQALHDGAGQRLRASAPGYCSLLLENLCLPAGGTLELDVPLALACPESLKVVELQPRPINGHSRVRPGGTAHRYYRVVDRTLDTPVSGIAVRIDQGEAVFCSVLSDADGVIDIAIPESALGAGEEFTVAAISDSTIPPEEQVVFNCTHEYHSYPARTVYRCGGSCGLGWKWLKAEFETGSIVTLIDAAGDTPGPEELRVRRQMLVGMGAHGELGSGEWGPPLQTTGTIAGSASGGLSISGEVLAYAQRDDEYEFPWPPASDGDAFLMYVLFADGTVEAADNAVLNLLSVIAEFVDLSSLFSASYNGDGMTFGVRAGVDIEGEIGWGGRTTPLSASFTGELGADRGYSVGSFYDRKRSERICGTTMTGSWRGNLSLGVGLAGPSQGSRRQATQDLLTGYLGGSLLDVGSEFTFHNYSRKVEDASETREMGFECVTGGAESSTETYRLWTAHPGLIEAIEAGGGTTVWAAAHLLDSSFSGTISGSDFLNDLVLSGDGVFAWQEATDGSVGFDGEQDVLHYAREEEDIWAWPPDGAVDVEISADGLPVSLSWSPYAFQSAGHLGMMEEGVWILGRAYPRQVYGENPGASDLDYEVLIQQICDAIPDWVTELAFPLRPLFVWARENSAGSDRESIEILLGDGRSTLQIDPAQVPPGIDPTACYWSWSPPVSARRVQLHSRELVRQWRKRAEESFGMRYGIGGFHQLEPDRTPLSGQAILTLSYPDSEVVDLDESGLAVYQEDKANHRFIYQGGVVDVDSNTVTVPISSLGTYTLAPRLPFGTIMMTATPSTIPADGTSSTTIQTDLLHSNDGTLVPDGSLYSVSSTNGDITTTDADTSVGVQVGVSGNRLTFSLRASRVAFPAIVRILSVNGSAAGMDTISFSDTGTPNPPTGLEVASVGEGSVELRWDAAEEADLSGYRVYFDSDSSAPPYTGRVAVTGVPSPVDVSADTTVTLMGLDAQAVYYMCVTAYDFSGNESDYSSTILSVMPSDVADVGPSAPVLYQSAPNPSGPRTTIRFALPKPGKVSLRIFDVTGRLVRTLVDGELALGEHKALWECENDHGIRVSAGVYFYQLETPQGSLRKKMVVMK